jgi:hypothetical protein
MISRAQTLEGKVLPILSVGVQKWWAVCDGADPDSPESWYLVKAPAVVKRGTVLGPFDKVDEAVREASAYAGKVRKPK